MIYGYYAELLENLPLLQIFSEDKWMSIQDLTYWGTLHFCIVSEELFSQMVSPELWGQARVKFITNSGQKLTSEELVPMAILVTDGFGRGTWEWQPYFAGLTRQKWSHQLCF